MTHSEAAAASWFNSVGGGWPNLLQGLGSAVIGGIVAAVTAWLVVRWSHKSNMRLASELDARAVVRSLTTDSAKVLTDHHEMANQPWRDDLETELARSQSAVRLARMRFGAAVNISLPSIALVDGDFVASLSKIIEQIDLTFGQAENQIQRLRDLLPEGSDESDPGATVTEPLEAVALQINGFLQAASSWLEKRK